MKLLRRILLSMVLLFPLSALGKVKVIADAGTDQTVSEGNLVTLYGKAKLKGVRQKKHQTISYSWEQITGTSVDLIDSDKKNASFVAPRPSALEETLQFELTVSATVGKCQKPWWWSRFQNWWPWKHKFKGWWPRHNCRTVTDTDSVNITVVAIDTGSLIKGHVTDVAGNAVVADIEVLHNGSVLPSVASNSLGDFELGLSDDTEYVLKFTAPGYAVQSVPVKSPTVDESIFLEVTMIARSDEQTFDSSSTATIRGVDGASVTLSPNSFVDGEGNPVVGDIQVTVTPVDISRSATLAAFPGEFSGVVEGDTEDTPIVSLGAVEFVFTQSGQELQLASGQTAAVEIPIYFATYQDGTAINIGDMIPLWSLNADTGIWTQEGMGTVVASADSPTGMAMSATVSHFSWWNCDVSMSAAQAIVTVYGSESGTAIVKAHTNADIGWRPSTVETVVTLGVATSPLYIPSNGEVCFWAEINYTSGSTATTLQECVSAVPSSLIYVNLVAPVAGPVDIITQPADTSGVLDEVGYIDFPVFPVRLSPTTIENTVSYSVISGSLPGGMSLVVMDATRALIVGIPTEAGSFSAVIQGEDEDGYTDSVTINYTISSDTPPPELPSNINASYNSSGVVDLTAFNIGGPATSWALSYNPAWEQEPPPPGVSLDSATGLLTISDSCIWWDGLVTATNASGSSEVSIMIYDQNCG